MPALHNPLLLQHKCPSLVPFVEHRKAHKASQRLRQLSSADSPRSKIRPAEAAVQRRQVLQHMLLAATAGALSGVGESAHVLPALVWCSY